MLQKVSGHFSPHGHFAPSHFAPTKSHFAAYSKSLRPIQELLCSIQKLLSTDKFARFSVKAESDNLFVSTWSLTKVNVSESSQFVRELDVSESTQNTLANRLGMLANWTFNSKTTC